MFLAGVDGNRTHRGRDAPPIGFEDRERHQATSYSQSGERVIYQFCCAASRNLCGGESWLDNLVAFGHGLNGFEHIGNIAHCKLFLEVEEFEAESAGANFYSLLFQLLQGFENL